MNISSERIFSDTKNLIEKYKSRNPKDIIEELGIKLITFKEDTKLLGMFKDIGGMSFIFYNPYLSTNLTNMVLAHELGHYIYHRDIFESGLHFDYNLFKQSNSLELEANLFAAHLLLDENEILNSLEEGYSYLDLAKNYNVDINLMIFKINEMHKLGFPVSKIEDGDSSFFRNIERGTNFDWFHKKFSSKNNTRPKL